MASKSLEKKSHKKKRTYRDALKYCAEKIEFASPLTTKEYKY